MAREPVKEWYVDDVINNCLPEIDEKVRQGIIDRIEEIIRQKVDDAVLDERAGDDL